MHQTDGGPLNLDRIEARLGTLHLRADFTIRPAALTAVIGPSGSGKSSLLSTIAGFLPLDAGQIRWGETPLDQLPPGDRPVSILFQDNNLFPHLSAERNIGLGISPAARLGPADKSRVAETLGSLGLAGLGARKPRTLSGGQQGRVALGRILVSDRPVVLLDEPFSALGPGLRQELLTLIRNKLAGRTVLMVSHDPQDALVFADETIFVEDGLVAPPRPTKQVFAEPSPALAAYLGR